MNELVSALGRWLGNLKVFVMVQPWEQGLRVRLGKTLKLLGPGPHFKMPFIDEVYRQSVRLRTAPVPLQTVSTFDGATLTIGVTLGYSIEDIEKLYDTLHHAEDTLAQMAAACVARAVYSSSKDAVTAEALAASVTAELAVDFTDFGLGNVDARVTDFAFVRTLRLLQDQRWFAGNSDHLSTTGDRDPAPERGGQ